MATKDPIMQRALALTKLKYGSNANSILQAIAEAGAVRKSSIAQAKAGAKYSTDAERYGQVGINKAFDGIRDAAAQSGAYMDKLSPVADGTPGSALMAAIQNSRQNMPQNIANQRALAITDSESRAARARAGGDFAVQAANATFQGNVSKLRDQLAQVQDDAATSTSTTYQDLLDDYNKEQRLAGDSAERARHNRAMENKGGGKGGRSRTQRLTTQENFDKYLSPYTSNDRIAMSQDPVTKAVTYWTLADAKQGVLGNGNRVSKSTALSLYEKRIYDSIAPKAGSTMAKAVAQTAVWGGVGQGTYDAFYKKYQVRLHRYKKK